MAQAWSPDVLAAIGTIAAVIVAIFNESFWNWYRRPKLDMSIRLRSPDCYKTLFVNKTIRERIERYSFRLAVTNRGRKRADDAEIYVAELSKKGDDGTFYRFQGFPPMDLMWSHVQRPFQSIAPGMTRHCDLGHIDGPATGPEAMEFDLDHTATFVFDLEAPLHASGATLGTGTYHAKVFLGAANMTSRKHVIEIVFTGEWIEEETEMFKHGIRITVLS